MNIDAPVSAIMSIDLKTLRGRDSIAKAKEIFDAYKIHHLPIIGFNTIKGILSKADLIYFLRGSIRGKGDGLLEETRLKSWTVEEIMVEEVVTLQKDAPIQNALEIFKENKVHCLCILDGQKLVGVLTPHDIILGLLKNSWNKAFIKAAPISNGSVKVE